MRKTLDSVKDTLTGTPVRTAITTTMMTAFAMLTVYSVGCAKDCNTIPNDMKQMLGHMLKHTIETNANGVYAAMSILNSIGAGMTAGTLHKLWNSCKTPAAETESLIINATTPTNTAPA